MGVEQLVHEDFVTAVKCCVRCIMNRRLMDDQGECVLPRPQAESSTVFQRKRFHLELPQQLLQMSDFHHSDLSETRCDGAGTSGYLRLGGFPGCILQWHEDDRGND